MPSTTWTIPIDGTKKAIGPFPFKVRSITIENRCSAGNIWAVDDRGAQYEATPLTAVQSKAEDTTYLTVYCDAPQAVGAASIIVSDSEPLLDVSTSQLTSQATSAAGSNVIIPTVALASFPPAAPVDGQLVALILPASFDPVGGKPVRWLAQYDAANALWHVEGPPIFAIQDTEETLTGNGAYQDTANTCALTIPRAGDYLIDNGGSLVAANTSFAYGISYTNGPTAASDADQIGDLTRNGISFTNGVRRREKTIAAANAVLKQQTKGSGAGLYVVNRRWLSATPLRIT